MISSAPLADHLPRFDHLVRLAGAALLGFGLITWIAANWDSFGRMQKFWLTGGLMLGFAAVAALVSSWRTPASLGAFLAIGALFALFGQTYQTGADPWQLFALWAVLGLPIALAARHDVIFVPWLVVAFAALHLFVASNSNFFALPHLGLALPIWLGGFGLVALLYVFNRTRLGEGSAWWSVQLGALVLATLIGGVAGPAVFSRFNGEVYWVGLLALAALAALCTMLNPREYVAMAVFVLAVDILLIVRIGYAVFIGSGSESSKMLTLAVIAAAIVAASGWLLLRLAPVRSGRVALADSGLSGPDHETKVTWPAAVVSGIGALIASIPFYGFLGTAFYVFIKSGASLLTVGLAMVAGAVFGLRVGRTLGFLQQFAFIALVAGLGLCAAGLVTVFDIDRTKFFFVPLVLLALLTLVTALANPVGWINGALGAAGAASIGGAIFAEIMARKLASPFTGASTAAVALTLALAVAQYLWNRHHNADTGSYRTALKAYVAGATVLALVALMGTAGRTFMAPAFSPVGGNGAIPELQQGWFWHQIFSALCAAVGVFLLLERFRALAFVPGLVLAAALVAFSGFSPNMGPTILLGSVVFLVGKRGLTLLAIVAGLWIAGTFYYWLGWPLVNKAYLLAGLGLGLIATSLASDNGSEGVVRTEAGPAGWLPPAVLALLCLAGPLVAAGVTIAGVRDNENVIATGRKIYLRTVPRDPRSLVQGDYMALNFQGGRMSNPIEGTERALYARADLDARGIATPKSFSEKPEPAGPGEIVFPLRWKGGFWIVVTDAWHFKEGTGPRFANAQYGEFRLRADGRMLLVGLADADLKPLN